MRTMKTILIFVGILAISACALSMKHLADSLDVVVLNPQHYEPGTGMVYDIGAASVMWDPIFSETGYPYKIDIYYNNQNNFSSALVRKDCVGGPIYFSGLTTGTVYYFWLVVKSNPDSTPVGLYSPPLPIQ